MLLVLLVLLLTAFVLVWAYYRQKFTYWNSKNVLTPPNPSIPWGHLKNPLSAATSNQGILLIEAYHYFRSCEAIHGGIYLATTPVYIPMDIELIKRILIKDFHHFDEKGLYYHEEAQPISAHLFQIGGEKWRNMRQKVIPTFSSSKLKEMFPYVRNCSRTMMEYISTRKVIDIHRVASDYTIDVIGTCVFGIDINSFQNPNSQFYYYGGKVFFVDTKRALCQFMIQFLPKLCHALNVVHHYRDVEKFFTELITETVRLREAEGATKRNDFLNLLLELKRQGKGIELQDIITQSFLFFVAGFDSSAGVIGNLIFEVAQQPAIQLKIKQEIDDILEKHNGELTYEGIQEMTYMNQVVEETLRKYPFLGILNRECSKDYRVPGTNVTIEKGTQVFVPVLAIHWDPNIYPRPHIFDPERFSAENKSTRGVCSWLGFGEGPRHCIGFRFANLQTKIALASLFNEYNFKLSEMSKRPLTFSKGVVLKRKQAVLIEIQKWRDTNIDTFLNEDRQLMQNTDIDINEIIQLLALGKVPAPSSSMY